MKKLTYTVISVFLCAIIQSCKNDRPEEFIYLNEVKIDSVHFAVSIYSKIKSDSTILYCDTLLGKIQSGEKFETEWYDDSVKCLVPKYIPEKTFQTNTNLKVILKHK
ncbi:hypothetical protein [Flavobacterium sp.]|uniref:hypothetical protein n=1 Tax=Flavobacterium sp. TaxID=239 RepID=UPI002B4B7361|nr:hypothetical protein [Flavobacterium sp.]HLP63144.1 hypothetical protein [Flavobacterium sp.]